MALATLSIDLTAKIAQFEKDLGRAATVAEQNAERIRATLLKVGQFATAALGGVTAGALVSMVRAQVDAIDGFNDLKDATGASIENISALDSLARRTGVTFETVGSTLIKFNSALKEAGDSDKGAGRVFQALGLDVEKLKQLDPAEALRQTAVALSQFADDGNKARAVQELFGKSLREVAPLLKDLGEEGQLYAKITEEQAEQAEKFNKQLYAMQAASTDAARQMTAQLLPTLISITEGFTKGSGSASVFEAAGTALKVVLQTVAVVGSDLVFVFKGIGREVGAIAAQAAAIARLDFKGASAIRQELTFDNTKARQELDAYQRKVLGLDPAAPASPASARASLNVPPKPEKGGNGPDLAAQGEKLALSLTAQDAHLSGDFFEKWDKLSAAYKGNKISLQQLTDAQAILLKQQPFMKEAAYSGDVSDALSRRLDATERARKATEELNAELDRLSGRTGDDRKRQLTAALEERLNAGEVFSQEELDRIVRGIGGITQATDDAAKSTVNYADVFESSFERAIVKGENLKEVLKGLAQDLATLYLRENVTKPLAKSSSDWIGNVLGGLKFGGGGGAVNTGTVTGADLSVAFAKGGVMTSRGPVPLRTYSNGGVANSPQLAMYGEGSTAEAYVPLPDGRRIPVAMRGGGGRPIVQHINMTVGDVADMARVRDEIRAANAEAFARMRRSGGYGGGAV